jgi:uncharacterized protein YndB with AHSA1/START domain
VPTTRRSRTIQAPLPSLWELVRDPHHLPRWWPRVERVEDVREGAFTEVMRTKKGKVVRADFDFVSDERSHTLTLVQRIAGTPFASVLRSAETELRLRTSGEPATEVTIELRQEMGRHRNHPAGAGSFGTGAWPRLGGRLIARAARATLEEALDGLERIGA